MKDDKILLFFINPFLSAVYSVIHLKQKYSLAILFAWFLVFGFCFSVGSHDMDAYYYMKLFEEQSHYTISDYTSRIGDFFTFDSDVRDIYTLTANFIVSRFSSNYHWLFLFYAFVFGFFCIRSLKYFVENNQCTSSVFFALLFLFYISNPIFNINGVRFWTASWIAVYSLLRILFDEKYLYVILLCATPLVHAGFIVIIPIAFLVLFSTKWTVFWFVVYSISSFFSIISLVDVVSDQLSFLPTITQSMIVANTEQGMNIMQYGGKDLPLYARILDALPTYICIVLSVILFVQRKRYKNDFYLKLLSVYFIIASFANLTMNIPSTGIRFIRLSYPFLAILLLNNEYVVRRYKYLISIGIPIAFAYSFVLPLIRNLMVSTEIYLYVLPFPVSFFNYLVFS